MLTAVQEGNIRFYTVNTLSPTFCQLQQAGRPSTTAQSAPAEPPAHAIPVGVIAAAPLPPGDRERQTRWEGWRRPLGTPVLVAATVTGMALVLIVTTLFYHTMTNDRLASAMRHALTVRPGGVTVVTPAPSPTTGVMRGSRWQIVPGAMGGFSSGASNETY